MSAGTSRHPQGLARAGRGLQCLGSRTHHRPRNSRSKWTLPGDADAFADTPYRELREFPQRAYASEAERYRRLGEGQQKPSIMMIACCDSRAAPETVFDAGPGEIFVVRNVANLVPPYTPDGGHHSTSAALEFAVLSLGVKHVAIMGHGRCGGIRAVTQAGSPLTSTDFIGSWMRAVNDVAHIVPRDDAATDGEHERHIEHASIKHSLANLRTFPWIRMKENRAELSLHGVWFDISLGELHVFDEDTAEWAPLQVQSR